MAEIRVDTDTKMSNKDINTDDTMIVSGTEETQQSALAWSSEHDDGYTTLFSDDEPGYLKALLRGFGVTLGILLPVAAIVTLSVLLFRAEDRPAPGSPSPTSQSATPTDTRPQADTIPTEITIPTETLDTIPVAATLDKDSRFIAILAAGKLHIYPQSHALDNAHAVCANLANGEPGPDVVNDIYWVTSSITREQAAFFVQVAVSLYCPQ
jgi:Protein of unknown function (DUF732)